MLARTLRSTENEHVREIVYVSSRMLQQFYETNPRKRVLSKVRSIGVKLPFLSSEVTVGTGEPGFDAHRSLESAIHYLESGAGRVLWYEDNSVAAGDWVQFEVQLNCAIVKVDEKHLALTGGRPEIAVFWQPFLELDERRTRILLIGDPGELVDNTGSFALRSSLSTSSILQDIMPAISGERRRWRPGGTLLSLDLVELEVELDIDTDATAMWYAGYARVSASLSSANTACPPWWKSYRYVIANLLYAEHVTSPKQD